MILIGYDMKDGLEALSIQAHIYYVGTVCRPGFWSCWQNFFLVAIIAKLGGEDIPIELDRGVAHGVPNSFVAFVFRLEPENSVVIVFLASFLARSSEGSTSLGIGWILSFSKYWTYLPTVSFA